MSLDSSSPFSSFSSVSSSEFVLLLKIRNQTAAVTLKQDVMFSRGGKLNCMTVHFQIIQ